MDFFKCLAVLHLVILSAPFAVAMNESVDHISQLPKPVISLIAQKLELSKDLENFACANKKINASVKPELSRRSQEKFRTLCVSENLNSVDLRPMVRMSKICTFFNISETKKEDYESLNKLVLNFIKTVFTRRILNSRQAAIDSLVRLVKNGYDEAIIYAKDCVRKWKTAKRDYLIANREILIKVLDTVVKKNKFKNQKKRKQN